VAQPRTPHNQDLIWNVLTMLVWLGILLVGILVVVIYVNPQTPLNPFPPHALMTLPPTATAFVLPSETQMPITQPPVTQTPTATATATATVEPTRLPGTPLSETPMATSTATLRSPYAFAVQGKPNAVSATLYQPDRGCDWLGVAGRVFDLQGSPAVGIRVLLRGTLGGKPISLLSLTGTAPLYGSSGYEFTLAERPLASRGTLWVQLLDQADLPLSPQVPFDTFAECDKNLILIDFKQVR